MIALRSEGEPPLRVLAHGDGVHDPQLGKRLIQAGTDGIITNDPGTFEALSTT